jgi:hypothetical protein
MISFSAVGSGCSFWKNPKVKTSENYRDFALRSFALYSSFLLNTEIDYPVLDSEFLHNKLMMLDKTNWSLKS